jgi:hypothetical protein
VSISRERLGRSIRLVAAAYVLALALLPFGHHDLVCHLKSSTHCTTCLAGTSADDNTAQPTQLTVTLADAGQTVETPHTSATSCVPASSSGRSPPANTVPVV